MSADVVIRRMTEADVPAADRIFRAAFGTFLGLRDPSAFAGDTDYVGTRFRGEPEAAFVAEVDGEVVGSNLAIRRGSVAFFGPLSVDPTRWEGGFAKRLVAATVDVFDRWGTTHAGLFTFSQSAKHVALYQKFGFWPDSLMAAMAYPMAKLAPIGASRDAGSFALLSAMEKGEAEDALAACRALAGSIHPGLDATREMELALRFGLGDVVLLQDGGSLRAFALCHCGAGSEAGSGACFAKFALVRPGPGDAEAFDRLLDACVAMATARGLAHLVVGVSLGSRAAYRRLLQRGFRTELQGVAMHRPDEPAYHSRDLYVLDDWR
ncbi:MAG: GNAT family N-acetyltransferase [Deltaproteobacteria bacterium]|nr:GNAT family N-acetyltransferase [Deltaproteobacteria bacterium]